MGRQAADMTADGVYGPQDLAAMEAAFEESCRMLGPLAEDEQVRRAMALVIAHHYELGIRALRGIAAAAANAGRGVGGKVPAPPIGWRA